MSPFRQTVPMRTCTKSFARYTDYKPYLRQDFNKRCGYCDDLDVLCNGRRGFHIDHFRPRQFGHLLNDYGNLVYACPYCNGGKSDDWPSSDAEVCFVGDRGYVDPCDTDFDNHFERQSNGRIRPQTDIGRYMFIQLKLGLRRHELAWMYERLQTLLCDIINEMESFTGEPITRQQLMESHLAVTKEFLNYKFLFEETLS